MISEKKHLFWIDGIKAFAIIGILLNHFVESFGSFPWFSNPSYNWPDFATRISAIFPSNGPILWKIIQFLGWLGDMGPGVFILVSGFSLALSALNRNEKKINTIDFYLKRLVRIFPLFLVIHLIVMLIGVVLHESSGNFTSPMIFLSMLGLRFTDGLFGFINPSWWFIWLLIQLYLLFPLLYKLLVSKGIQFFILTTLGFTILSRLAGLIGHTYSDYLEYWMMGIFFGTRLFEFAAGMILAKLFIEKRFDPWNIDVKRLFFLSLAIYCTGFVCSLFYPTTLISGVLITLGLSGFLLFLCKIIELFAPVLIKSVKWIGGASFTVFLIHQPIMLWLGNDYNGITKAFAEGFILILVFPLGWLLERVINQVVLLLPKIKNNIKVTIIVLSISAQLFLNLGFFISQNNLIYKLNIVVFIINIFFIPLYALLGNKITPQSIKSVLLAFLPSSVLFLFVLTDNWFSIFWIFIAILLAGILLMSLFTKNELIRIVVPYVLVFLLFVSFEGLLSYSRPMEVNKWGELPALQKDSLTIYSLIPDKKTHLKYNNYDYSVSTNLLGFNGPEVTVAEKDINEIRILCIGDAFTMPEGIEYEKAYPELLQNLLRENYPNLRIQIFNGGVTGYGPNEEYAQVKKYIDIIKPDIVLNEVFINEFEEINFTEEQRLNSIGLREYSIRERLFSGLQSPEQIRTWFHKLLDDNIYRTYTYFRSLAYFYDRSSDLYSESNINKVRDYLAKTKLLCEQKSCQLTILYAPGQLEVSSPEDISFFPGHIQLNDSIKYDLNLPEKIYCKLCNELDIPFFNPVQLLKSNPVQPVYYSKSWHWNGEGHQVIANYIYQEILKSNLNSRYEK